LTVRDNSGLTPFELAQRALDPFVGRRLLEAANYDDLFMLVFSADGEDQTDRGGRQRVRWAVTTYEHWLLLSPTEIAARRGDESGMDIQAFAPVIGHELRDAHVRERDLALYLSFDGDHVLLVVPPASVADPNGAGDTLWNLTQPSLVVQATASELTVEEKTPDGNWETHTYAWTP
jgi:hypothetical protein